MESRFGAGLADVRVHTSPSAAASADALGATAYTIGRDIVFGPGAYRPNEPAGRALLAHELTHVLQQTAGRNAPKAAGTTAAECEADQSARSVEVGGAATVATRTPVRVARAERGWFARLAAPKKLYDEAVDAAKDAVRKKIETQIGKTEAVLLEVGGVVDTIVSVPYARADVIDWAVDGAAEQAGLSPEKRRQLRAAARRAALDPRLESLAEQARKVGAVDPVTGTPAVSHLVTKPGDRLERALDHSVLARTKPDDSILTDREAAQLAEAVKLNVALALVGEKEVETALRAIGSIGVLSNAVNVARQEREVHGSFVDRRDFWLAVGAAVLHFLGLRAASAGRKLLPLFAEAAGAVLAIAPPVLRFADHLSNHHGPDRDEVLHRDLIGVVRVALDVMRRVILRVIAGRRAGQQPVPGQVGTAWPSASATGEAAPTPPDRPSAAVAPPAPVTGPRGETPPRVIGPPRAPAPSSVPAGGRTSVRSPVVPAAPKGTRPPGPPGPAGMEHEPPPPVARPPGAPTSTGPKRSLDAAEEPELVAVGGAPPRAGKATSSGGGAATPPATRPPRRSAEPGGTTRDPAGTRAAAEPESPTPPAGPGGKLGVTAREPEGPTPPRGVGARPALPARGPATPSVEPTRPGPPGATAATPKPRQPGVAEAGERVRTATNNVQRKKDRQAKAEEIVRRAEGRLAEARARGGATKRIEKDLTAARNRLAAVRTEVDAATDELGNRQNALAEARARVQARAAARAGRGRARRMVADDAYDPSLLRPNRRSFPVKPVGIRFHGAGGKDAGLWVFEDPFSVGVEPLKGATRQLRGHDFERQGRQEADVHFRDHFEAGGRRRISDVNRYEYKLVTRLREGDLDQIWDMFVRYHQERTAGGKPAAPLLVMPRPAPAERAARMATYRDLAYWVAVFRHVTGMRVNLGVREAYDKPR